MSPRRRPSRGALAVAGLVSLLLVVVPLVSSATARPTPLAASGLQVAVTGGPTSGRLPLNVSLMASASGGIGPYNYSWTIDGGAPVGFGPTLSYEFALAGTYNVTVDAQDAFGEPGNASVTVTVLPPGLAVSLTADPSSLMAGSATYLEANVSGGVPPYSYLWSGLPPGCVGGDDASLRCVPIAAAGYSVRVNVTDASGGSATDVVGLVVTPGNSTPPTPAPSEPAPAPSWELVAIVVGAAGAGAAIGIAVRGRRRP